ncbi:MAG TPA: ArsA-related P-loop ATPase [Haliangiales bacterium]|nr:ArsA-related P-loop ATPase [Haliangiales bacterium]
MPRSLRTVLSEKRILVCAGSGGVGKTTTAAAIGLEGARTGLATLVLTIDPAKRLANSLGIERLDHSERRVPPEILRAAGPVHRGGELYAMMLDQKRAFDEVVERYAADPAARDRILENRIYEQISSSLSGSHEYAAMAKLQQLDRDGRYDLIVVDTPPTAHALDFLDAPEKVAGAIDSPALEWFAKPMRATGRFSLKLAGAGGTFVLKRIAKFVGSSFLEDMARFFVEFNDVLGGFRERAREVFDLLRTPKVGFVLVAAPEPTVVDEVLFFQQRLASSNMPFSGFVVNRVHAEAPPAPDPGELASQLRAQDALARFSDEEIASARDALLAAYRELGALAEADRLQILRLRQAAADQPVATVPFLARDVHDVTSLALLARHIFA